MSNINSHNNNSRPQSPPWILTVPNEVLHRILSFIPCLPLDGRPPDYSQINHDSFSQLRVLRSVCRHFRAITLEVDFWYESDFQFTRFLPSSSLNKDINPNHPDGISLRHAQEARCLTVLFKDDALLDYFGRRKTEWTFESVDVLETVMQCIPLFRKNARAIKLDIMFGQEDFGIDLNAVGSKSRRPTLLNTAISLLSSCEHITTLEIPEGYSLNLGKIASLRHLEILRCSVRNFIYGSLKKLKHLKELQMNISYISQPIPLWLPLQSASKLTDLTLTCNYYGSTSVAKEFFGIPSIQQFTNLTSLHVEPLSISLCKYLLQSSCHLSTFSTAIAAHSLPEDLIKHIFKAPCLRTITQLKLSTVDDCEPYFDSSEEDYWRIVFDSFTSSLPSVQEIQLDVPLIVGCCQFFSRMRNLKLLEWDGSPYSSHQYFPKQAENPKQNVVEALNKAFEEFVEKPQIEVLGGPEARDVDIEGFVIV